ncbi:hypothetical protein ASPTUDRAFT_804101 [Aspergillus tubingensis CBS 134.48]|uniref:Uncharacterized protein n=1 Tax=Aspergillus tubingensis (strain CBS 134.48) TaxID=767770 RepID=A0A1L9MVS0_ASPTC|nr:hypothetical protein ASPTUDRAFT_804101 [Aspergillus tubingensis CBS 134.48]
MFTRQFSGEQQFSRHNALDKYDLHLDVFYFMYRRLSLGVRLRWLGTVSTPLVTAKINRLVVLGNELGARKVHAASVLQKPAELLTSSDMSRVDVRQAAIRPSSGISTRFPSGLPGCPDCSTMTYSAWL